MQALNNMIIHPTPARECDSSLRTRLPSIRQYDSIYNKHGDEIDDRI